MLQKRIVQCFAMLLLSTVSFAQVNLQTGSAVFSLPMFNWQDNHSRLNSVVALSYNSGNGLKVNDIASNVGQGWNLVAGGVITRMQVGEPDDQVAFSGNNGGGDWDISKYPAGILYATVPASNGCPNTLTKYPLYGSMNQLYAQRNLIAEDKQLDYFSFQFNGKAGMFVVDPTNLGTCKSLGDTKMIITFQTDANLQSQGIRTKITSFTVKDVDGLIYKFTLHGLTKVLQANYCDANLQQDYRQPNFQGGGVYHQTGFDNGVFVNPWVIGNWYLTEIEDGLTHSKIYFNYSLRYINNIAGNDITYNSDKNYSIIFHKKSISQSQELSSIVYPDGHTVTFNYGNDRIDFDGEKVLSSVDITYQGRYLSKYILNTTYFILNRYGTPTSDYQKSVARLCLRSVKKIGVDLKEDSPPYIFDYYLGSNTTDDFVPPPFFYTKDIWGFYNGNNSVRYEDNTPLPLNVSVSSLTNSQLKGLCFLHSGVTGVYLNAKSGYAKNGLLKQIIYPTGGTLTYQYDQNSGVLNGTTNNVGGVHVSQTSSTDGGYSNGCNNPITTQYNNVLSDGSTSSLWGLEMPVNGILTQNYYDPEVKRWHWTLSSAPFGECYYKFFHPGIMSQQQAITLEGFQHFMQAAGPYLGILTMVSDIIDFATLIGSSSPGPGTIIAVIIDVICGYITLGITCLHNYTNDASAYMYYNMDLNGASPLPSQFKRVEVVENPGTIGKTVQEFTSSDDYPIWEFSNPAQSAKQRFAPWAYGLPKRTTVYDVNGNKIKETENKYDTSYSKHTALSTSLVSCKCLVTHSRSQRSDDWSNLNLYNSTYLTSSNTDMKVDLYGMYTGRTNLDTTFERIYKTNDQTQYVETYTIYYYNNTNNYEPLEIWTQQSNGDIDSKVIRYSSDFNTGVLATLVQNNIVSLPISTTSFVSKNGTGSGSLNEKVTEFVQLANGDIKPYRTLEQRFAQPSNNMNSYQGPGSNISNYKIPQIFTYDANGNLIGLKDEGNRNVSNIYDYNDKYVVASIINADPSTDKTAYTSFETDNFGGWQLVETTWQYNSSTSVTGARSFTFNQSGGTGAQLIANSLNTSKPYKVSFWATGSNVSVDGGATLVKSSPTINGFTYYEYDITQGTSSVSIHSSSGSVTIDELRIYPANSRMRTITYDPLIGKTSECDENNRITYYEYDNLGRLRFVKDEKSNALKMYEYNNVSAAKQNGCPGTYYNHLISESFTKNNCGSGYAGSTVTYTVAANTYSSSISQEDADVQAENYILSNGQNYANTNGSCSLIYYNTAHSVTDTTQGCSVGYLGGGVTYTVPAGRYSSIVSQADADQKALDEIAANAQAYANDPAHRVCTYSTSPDWQWDFGGSTQCQCVSGEMHKFLLTTDVNPNSSTYNQTSWRDAGPDASCGSCPTNKTLHFYNNESCYYQVYLQNTSTNDEYWINLDPSSYNELNIEAGTYNIQIYLYSGNCDPPIIFTVQGDYTEYNYTGWFYDMPFTTNLWMAITIDQY